MSESEAANISQARIQLAASTISSDTENQHSSSFFFEGKQTQGDLNKKETSSRTGKIRLHSLDFSHGKIVHRKSSIQEPPVLKFVTEMDEATDMDFDEGMLRFK